MKKAKKKSIREFVSEEDLKFQIYLVKYSGMLKDIRTKTEQEVIKTFEDDVNKRLKSIKKERIKVSTIEEDQNIKIMKTALEINQDYVSKLSPLTTKEQVLDQFESKKANYVEYLINRIEEEQRTVDIDMLKYARKVQLTENVSKEKFGEMLLLIIKNMATMPSFSGYTENWKTDFYSNAVEKTLLYVHNFDENLKSKRTGNKSKAFAYVTQICFNAFINVINIRKAASTFIKDRISFNSSNVEGIRNQIVNESTKIEKANDKSNKESTLKVSLENPDSNMFIAEVKKIIESVKISNEININNNSIFSELKYLNETTKEEDKNEDYEDYCNDMLSNVKEPKYNYLVKSLIIEKSKNFKIKNTNVFTLPKEDFDISIISHREPKVETLDKLKLELDNIDTEDTEDNKSNLSNRNKSKNEIIIVMEDW